MKRLLIFTLLLGLAACRKEDRAAGPVIEDGDVRLSLELAGVVDESRWNLFRVRVRNRGLDFRGTLEVRGVVLGDRNDPVAYRLDLEVPGGSSTFREYAFPVRPEGWTDLVATFRQPGFGRSFRLTLPSPEAPAFRVLVIGDQVRDLKALEEHIAAELKKGATQQTPALEARLAFLRPSDCPTAGRAYDPFQLVLLDGTSLDDAPEGAIDALAAWAKDGGTLAAIPAPQWVGGPPDKLRDLFASATVLPEVSRAKNAVFPRPNERPELYRALDACLGRAASFAGDSGAGLREIERSIAGSLYALAGLHVPARGAVVLGLLVYALLGFFIPARIFKRLGRREWSFAVMVAAAGVAAFAIYGLGVLSSVGATEIEEVSVVRVAPDGKAGQAASFLGIISPGFERIDLKDAGGDSRLAGALPQPLRAERREIYRNGETLPIPETEIRIEKGRELRLAPVRLFPNAMHLLRYDHEAIVGDLLQVEHLDTVGDSTGVRIVNRSQAKMDLYVVQGARYARWQALQPGATAQGPVWKELHFGKPASPWDSNYSPGGDPEPGTERDDERLALLPALGGIVSPRAAVQPRWRRSSSGQEEDAKHGRPWGDDEPRYIIALARTPVFPPVERVAARKAISLFVIEVPPETAR